MAIWEKIHSIKKSLAVQFSNIQSKTFKLLDFTNGVPWVNPSIFSAATSIYTKDGNRFYRNTLSVSGDSVTVSNKTTGNTVINNTYADYPSPNKVLYNGADNRYTSHTFTNCYQASFSIGMTSRGGNNMSNSFDIYINGVKQKTVTTGTRGGTALSQVVQQVVEYQVVYYVYAFASAQGMRTTPGNIKIEVKNVKNYQGGLGLIYILKSSVETATAKATTYNDVLIYAIEEEK